MAPTGIFYALAIVFFIIAGIPPASPPWSRIQWQWWAFACLVIAMALIRG